MLRRIIEYARLIDHVRQMFWMTRWEAVVPSGFNVQQFIQWIAIRQPRGSFLIGAEKIATRIESHANGKTNPRANGLALLEIWRHFLNRAALALQAVARLAAGRVDQVGLEEIVCAQPEINVSLTVK